jgi:prepilin-type N-terminal cleavage/methylation domain-containing protein
MRKAAMRHKTHKPEGFTLIELLIGTVIMLIVIVAALAVYARSNKVAVDQQQYADLQNDVRSSMYFITRDLRSAGVGLTENVAGYFLEGTDGAGPAPESSDSLRIFGNFDDPLLIHIETYQGGTGGGSAQAALYDFEMENLPYPCPAYYENREVLVISTKCPGCFAFRHIDEGKISGCDGTGQEHVIFNPGASELNPPGGLIDETGCDSTCWDDSIMTLGQIKLYWLDTTGSLSNLGEFNLTAGDRGYLGIPYVLYLTTTDPRGVLMHMPLARNIENLQFQYNGDFDEDGTLDGFQDWDTANWTILSTDSQAQKQAKAELIQRIRQVQIWVVGRAENASVSVSGTPPAGVYLYQRPAVANSTTPGTMDRHRRFVLVSTSNVRNLSLNLYNSGER